MMDLSSTQEGQPLIGAVAPLQTLVNDHVRDEEKNLLPALAAKATAGYLDSLAARIEEVKQRTG